MKTYYLLVLSVLALIAITSSDALAEATCTPPPTCTGHSVSRWNGTAWECFDLDTLPTSVPSGTLCGLRAIIGCGGGGIYDDANYPPAPCNGEPIACNNNFDVSCPEGYTVKKTGLLPAYLYRFPNYEGSHIQMGWTFDDYGYIYTCVKN